MKTEEKVTAAINEAAAIQRGDGQGEQQYRPLGIGEKIVNGDQYLQDGRWHPCDKDSDGNGTLGEFYDNVNFNDIDERHLPHRRPIVTTPPADELRAKPNETSGATPIQFYGLSPSGCLVEDDDGDWVEADAYRQLERELAAVRAAGNHIGDANEMVADVRKSAGAEGTLHITGREEPDTFDELISDYGFASIERWKRDTEHTHSLQKRARENLHTYLAAAKSTPGVEAWQAIETAPKDGTRILCSYLGNRSFIARWRSDFSVFMDDWDSWRDATHWMPLPHPSAVKPDADGASGGKEGV